MGERKHKAEAEKRKTTLERIKLQEQQQPPLARLIQRARLDPSSLTPRDVTLLQPTMGNQAIGRLLTRTGQRQVIQDEDESSRDHTFTLDFVGGAAMFRECSGLNPRRNENISFKRGSASSDELWEWYTGIHDGSAEPKTLNIREHDAPGELVKEWIVRDAYPVRWKGQPQTIELFVITHQGLTLQN